MSTSVMKKVNSGCEISWDEMIGELHRVFAVEEVNVEEVKDILFAYKSNPADWKKYAYFDPGKYTRNLVDEGNGRFNLMMLCWAEGQASSIHDHADAHCFMKQLQGSLVESLFAWPEGEITDRSEIEEHGPALKLMRESQLNSNGVLYINDEIGIHRVSNPSHVEGAVSLHLVNSTPSFISISLIFL